MNDKTKSKLATHIVALNYFSLVFIILGVCLSYYFSDTTLKSIGYFLLWLYLLPPLLARLIITLFGRPVGMVSTDDRTHTLWWLLFQLQLIFNRFPILEEALRMIPGIYALWLNLWGAKVNMFSFWAPGVTVMDRYHLQIDKGVILGTESMLSAHVLVKKGNGELFLIVDKITINAEALIGVRSMVAPGCHIYPSQIVAAQKTLKPYTEIRDSKKTLTKDIDYK